MAKNPDVYPRFTKGYSQHSDSINMGVGRKNRKYSELGAGQLLIILNIWAENGLEQKDIFLRRSKI